VSRDARHHTGRDADFRAGRRRRPLLNPRKSGNRPVRTRLLVVLGELVHTTAGKWITHPPSRCPNGHPLGPGEVLVGHQACLGTAAGTPRGHAARAMRRSTGRRSTPSARRSMDRRPCASPATPAERLTAHSRPSPTPHAGGPNPFTAPIQIATRHRPDPRFPGLTMPLSNPANACLRRP
jgi:hypothetical protein